MKTYKIIGFDIKAGLRILPVKGEPISIKEYGDIELFIHKPLKAFLHTSLEEHPFKYYVSEVSTGRTAGKGKTRQGAINRAIENIKGCGYSGAKKILSKYLLDGVEHREVVE